jgi:AcrR family transcriptional regulator
VKAGKRPRGASGTRRTRRSAEDLLARIMRAATTEFARSGYSGTTTAAVARKADVTEAQLFRYFDSKADLFRETVFKPIDQHFLEFVRKHPPRSRQRTSAREGAELYTTELQQFIREHSGMLKSLVAQETYDNGETHGVSAIDSLRAYFNHGAASMRSRIKGKPRVNPELLVRLSFVTVLASILFKDWIFPRGLATDEDITEAINAFVIEGSSVNDRK